VEIHVICVAGCYHGHVCGFPWNRYWMLLTGKNPALLPHKLSTLQYGKKLPKKRMNVLRCHQQQNFWSFFNTSSISTHSNTHYSPSIFSHETVTHITTTITTTWERESSPNPNILLPQPKIRLLQKTQPAPLSHNSNLACFFISLP